MSRPLGFERICLRYGGQVVLEDFSLAITPGEAVCLSGPSGCGKTSLLRLLMELETPSSGQVHSLHPFSAVFQEDRLLPWLSAPGNLRLVTGKVGEENGIGLLRELGLGDELLKPVSAFSGGMKRRVALARALLVPAPLLLLDEPFTGLDPDTRSRAAALILKQHHGTLVMASHDQEDARLLGARLIRLP